MARQHSIEHVPTTAACRRKKLTATGLIWAIGFLSCAVPALGQSTVLQAAPSSNSAKSSPTALPAPSAQASARAREQFRKGTEALRARKSARAVKLFAAAHRLDPANATYIAAYEIARQQQVGGMLEMAGTDENLGKPDLAKQKLMEALETDPGNPYVEEHLRSVAGEPAVISAVPMPQFSSGLIELAPDPIRATFHLQGSAQDILKKIFEAYGIHVIFDDSVSTKPMRIDLANVTFAEASKALQLASNSFVVPLDSRQALIAESTKENRAKFERLLYETVFLPGLSQKQMSEPVNMIRTIFGPKQIAVRDDNGAIAIRAPEATLRAVNATLARLYLDRPEIMLDVRVYQVNDSRQEDLGVSFPQTLNIFNVTSELTSVINANQSTIAQLVASGLVNPGDLAGIAALLVGLGLVNGSVLNQPFALFGNGLTLSGLSFGGTTANASLNISNTRELDHIQLRAGDSEKQAFLIGSRYPVVTQSYSAGTQTPTGATSLAGLIAGSNQTTTAVTNPLSYAPTVEYQDLGLSINAMAHVVKGDDIQMDLKVKIAALAGVSINQSPIINNRSFTTAIQVHDGGSAMMTSSVSSTESRSLSGIPGLSELPGFSWTASPQTQLTVGKLLIVISPHIVSATHSSVASKILPLPPGSSLSESQ